jgi:hypothetical protein
MVPVPVIQGSTQTADKCWANFTTADSNIINRTTATSAGGEAETVKFKAQSGSSHFQPQGTYTATVTVTAVNQLACNSSNRPKHSIIQFLRKLK